jgi:ATP-dependent helicase/nuclease subunit A
MIPGLDRMTDRQREAVTRSRGLVCVEAGAGAGKTSVIAERFLNLVATEGLAPSEILTITFTRKAAQEMKQRIIGGLAAAGLTARRREVENAYIHTIHGFCERLLRENPFDAGVDPSFPVIDANEGTRFQERAFEVAAAQALASEGPLRELVAAGSTRGVFGREPGDLLASLRIQTAKLLDQVRSYGFTRERLVGWCEQAEAGIDAAHDDALRLVAEEARERLVGVLGPARDEGLASLRERIEATPTEDPRKWREEMEPVLAEIAALRPPGQSERARRAMTELKQAARQAMQRFGAVDEALEREAARHAAGLLRLALLTWERYDELKRADGSLDFSDLELGAATLLEECEPVRSRYRAKFRQILIDEFQDVNPLQAALVERLSSGDNVCFVGDPRQAIYGFRYCDLRQFVRWSAEVREMGMEDPEAAAHIPLDTNFRARPAILRFVARLMERGRRPEFGELIPSRQEAPTGPPVEVWLMPGYDTRQEGRLIAQGIRAMMSDPAAKIEEGGRLREPRWSDFALLFRATPAIGHYQAALYEAGIPNHIVRAGRNFYARYEVRDLRNALQALARPHDDMALACLLRSPLVGLSLDALTLLAAQPERPPLIETLGAHGLPAEDAAKLDRFLEWFLPLSRHVDRRQVGETLELVLRETDYPAKLLRREEGDRQLANVRKLLQMALDSGGSTIEQYVRRLDRLEKIAQREGDAPTHDEHANVVKLLTVHGAKGLEFPVVILAHLSYASPPFRDSFVADPSAPLLGAKLGDRASLRFDLLLERKKREIEDEEWRLLYVAMTRARDYLVLAVPGALRGNEECWAKWVKSMLGLHSHKVPAGERDVGGGASYMVRHLSEGALG